MFVRASAPPTANENECSWLSRACCAWTVPTWNALLALALDLVVIQVRALAERNSVTAFVKYVVVADADVALDDRRLANAALPRSDCAGATTASPLSIGDEERGGSAASTTAFACELDERAVVNERRVERGECVVLERRRSCRGAARDVRCRIEWPWQASSRERRCRGRRTTDRSARKLAIHEYQRVPAG